MSEPSPEIAIETGVGPNGERWSRRAMPHLRCRALDCAVALSDNLSRTPNVLAKAEKFLAWLREETSTTQEDETT